MTVTAGHVAALRAALTGDIAAFDRWERQCGQARGPEFAALMAASFIAAVRRRFPGGCSAADVIRFVGQVRARNSEHHDDLSPGLAEQLILSAAGNIPADVESGEIARAYTQFILLKDLTGDLGDHELDAFLAEAQHQAGRWAKPAELPGAAARE